MVISEVIISINQDNQFYKIYHDLVAMSLPKNPN